MFALVLLVHEYVVNPALRTRGIFAFLGGVIGDVIFIGCYFAYHLGNVIRGHLSNEAWCNATSWLSCIALTVYASSAVLIAFAAWVHISTIIANKPHCTATLLVGVILLRACLQGCGRACWLGVGWLQLSWVLSGACICTSMAQWAPIAVTTSRC